MHGWGIDLKGFFSSECEVRHWNSSVVTDPGWKDIKHLKQNNNKKNFKFSILFLKIYIFRYIFYSSSLRRVNSHIRQWSFHSWWTGQTEHGQTPGLSLLHYPSVTIHHSLLGLPLHQPFARDERQWTQKHAVHLPDPVIYWFSMGLSPPKSHYTHAPAFPLSAE